MDIMGLTKEVSSVNTGETMTNLDMAILSKTLYTDEQTGSVIANMLEHSVTPYKGGNIDVRV